MVKVNRVNVILERIEHISLFRSTLSIYYYIKALIKLKLIFLEGKDCKIFNYFLLYDDPVPKYWQILANIGLYMIFVASYC